ncbi:XdhC family protein [Massilia sp. CMS3.1]|uniref:XdhC family protein n=1 Tax=Massilia sp. CMS3.1 TaxID=3373083 RepID=UPI003EE53EC5
MDSMDVAVLKAAAQWIDHGLVCQLVTVVQTWGSSPRPEGAMMVIRADGRVTGSVSGGCIEDDLIEWTRRGGFPRDRPELLTYGIQAEDAHRFGLPGGGTIRLVCEPLTKGAELARSWRIWRKNARRSPARSRYRRRRRLRSQARGSRHRTSECNVKNYRPRWRLMIIGAGQLSELVARMAVMLDYEVLVCDPREEYRSGWNVKGVNIVHVMPDDWVLSERVDARTAVVALTHDPKLDDLALMEALRSEAFYVEAIGSRANTERRRERLLQFDVSALQLQRLHAPIGIFIGSKMPSEIAISILAQLTAARHL